jgi:hypothetical protein
MKKLTFILFLLTLAAGITRAGELRPTPVKAGQWIRSWMLVGPFTIEESKDPTKIADHLIGYSTDFLSSKGGETNPKIKDGDVIGSAKAFIYNSPDSVINLDQAISRTAPLVGYAYTEINSNEPKMWFVAFGSREGGSLWVNGEKVWDYQPQRSLLPDNDMIPVNLKKGTNTLLFKIERRKTNWQFFARMLPFSAEKLTTGGELFRVKLDENGEAQLSSRFSNPVLQQLIRKVDLQILDHQDKPLAKDEITNDYLRKLNIDTKDFKPYHATMAITLTNGEIINQPLSFSAGKRNEYTLFSDRKTRYRIALAPDASESEHWAAQELQHWLSEISGAYFPIQTITQHFRGPQIVIGYNDTLKSKLNLAKAG